MKKPTIAFTVITKNKPDKLVRLLDSTKGVFDFYCLQDTGSVDNSSIEAWVKWCKDNKKEYVTDKKEYPSVEVNGVQILADFSMARNDSLKLAKNLKADFIFWCDTDDVIMNAEALPEIANVMQKEGLKIAFMKYNYAMPDENGKVASEQWRERLYSLHTKNLKWAEPVHENLIADDVQGLGFKCSDVVVQHLRTAEETIETGRRNKLIMEKYFNDHGLKNTSLQLIRNYAYDAYEHREYTTAIKFYKLAIKRHLKEKDPMPEFLHDCYAKLFRCYMDKKMFKKALEISSRMVALMPKLAEPYMRSAEAYLMLGANELAISSAEVAIKIGKPQTLIPINEIEFQDLPRRIIAEAHLAMGNLQGAIAEYQDLYKLTGSSVYYRRLQELSRHADNERVVKAINTLQLHFEDEGYFDKLQYLSQTIPEDIKEQPLVKRMLTEIEADTERKLTPHKVTGKKKIVFYVGGGFEVWTPENIKQGIGGSEEMVINLARELAKLGNEVEVYNECRGKEGDYEGVKYIHHSKVDQIKADVLIVSRQPQAFDRIWDAKKQYLWLHDTYYGEQTRRRFNLADKVLVLTNAHKDIIKNAYGVKDSQFQVTRNGVDLGILPKEIDEANRNPHRLFWGSSYDRGLLELLEMWGDIKTQVPDAELHFCYGWNTFDAMMDARQGTEEGERMRQYKNKVLELLEKHKDTGIVDLGRVGQDKQLEIMATCGIWAYPTWFSEISCFTDSARVLTEMGEKRIVDVSISDRVFSHNGESMPINNLQRRAYNGELVEIKVQSGDDIESTPEHPYLVTSKGKGNRSFKGAMNSALDWKNAEDIKIGDVLVTPRINFGNYTPILFTNYNGKRNNFDTVEHMIPDGIAMDSDMSKWIGYFLGDGNASVRTGKVSVLVADKHPEHSWYGEYMSRFGTIKTRKLRGCTEYMIYSHKLARALTEHFYKNKMKCIDSRVYSNENADMILQGLLDADGSTYVRKISHATTKTFTNKSLSLIGFVRAALLRNGIGAKVTERIHENGNKSYSMYWSDDTDKQFYGRDDRFIYRKVKSVSKRKYEGGVYNMEVEKDNSYIVNGYAVHNCITAMKAQMVGTIPVVTPVSALKETVKYGIKVGDERLAMRKDKKTLDMYKDALISLMKDTKRQEMIRPVMMEKARELFRIDKLAEEWNKLFES